MNRFIYKAISFVLLKALEALLKKIIIPMVQQFYNHNNLTSDLSGLSLG